MKKHLKIFIIISLFLGCSKEKNRITDVEKVTNDSISIYLRLANEDTIPVKKRKEYAERVFTIEKSKPNDSIHRVNLFKAANRYYNVLDYKNYKGITITALEEAISAKDTTSIAKAYAYLGDYYNKIYVKDSAFYFYLKAEKIYGIQRDNANLASINISKADVLWNEQEYFGSESAALEALKYLRYIDDKGKAYQAFSLLGIVSNELGDYDKALEYLNKALVLINENNLNDSDELALTLNNIGNVYQNLGNNNKAVNNFKLALEDKNLRIKNPILYAVLLDNLAYSMFKLNKENKTIPKLFLEAIKVKDSLGNLTAVIFSKTRLSEYFFAVGDTLKAVNLSNEALTSAKKVNSTHDMLLPLKQLSVFEPQKSSVYSSQYIKINDSLQKAERKIKDKFARIQFETDEISLQKDALAEQNRNLLLFFVGTVMIGLLLFVIRTQRSKNRELMLKQAQQKANEDIYNLMLSQQNKIEEGRIKEKKRIAQELHDGVLGRLFGARLNLDSLNKANDEEAMAKRNNYLDELKNIEQDIREISHDLNREKFVLINNFVAILNNLLEEQAASFATEVDDDIDEKINWELVSNTLKINLYRIVQEALQNINKYAQATKVNVILEEEGENLKLTVSDNGVGFAVDKKSRGIGLQNMLTRTHECNGTLDISSKKGKGTTINILFPIGNKTENKNTNKQQLTTQQHDEEN